MTKRRIDEGRGEPQRTQRAQRGGGTIRTKRGKRGKRGEGEGGETTRGERRDGEKAKLDDGTAGRSAGVDFDRPGLTMPSRRKSMDKRIAFCGLDCGACEAYKATAEDDEVLRAEVARKWSELNGVEITPDMIQCDGCRVEGRKTPYCEHLCPVRQCAVAKGVETCGSCAGMEVCGKVGEIFAHAPEARRAYPLWSPYSPS